MSEEKCIFSEESSSSNDSPSWSKENCGADEERAHTDESSDSGYVKDRGYAWVVLIASFTCQVIGVGCALSAGTFTPTLVKIFNGSREEVAWVGSLHAGLIFMAGPVSGALADRFGHRPMIISGALMASCGVALSAFVTDLWMLYITYGVIGGTGICFTYIPAVTLLAKYFERYQYVAFSASSAGVGVGTLLLPQYIEWLLNEFGWRGAYILTAGMLLQIAICGVLMTDPPSSTSYCKKPRLKIDYDLRILNEWQFSLFLINNFLFNFGGLILFVFISDYGEQQGLTSQQGTYLISIIGISNCVGRIANSLFSACKCNRSYVYVLACTLSGVSVCFINLPADLGGKLCFFTLAIICAAYGVLFGVQLGNHAIVTHMLSGLTRLNAAFGLTMLLNGVGAMTGPPIAGLLYRLSGKFDAAFYTAGVTITISGLLLLPVLLANTSTAPSSEPSSSSDSFSSNEGGLTHMVIGSIPNMYKSCTLRNGSTPTHKSSIDIRHFSVSGHLAVQSSASYHVIPRS